MTSNKWNMNLRSGTVDDSYGLKGAFDLETGQAGFTQDVTKFQEQAKRDRDIEQYYGRVKNSHRKFATIPDSVALKILEDHGINLHDPSFINDKDKVNKFKQIMLSEYRDLVVNT